MNAELTNTRKRTRLDRKFDRLRDAEEAGKLGKSKTAVRCAKCWRTGWPSLDWLFSPLS